MDAPTLRTVDDYITAYHDRTGKEPPRTSTRNLTPVKIMKGMEDIAAWIPKDAPLIDAMTRKPRRYIPRNITHPISERRSRADLFFGMRTEGIYTDGHVMLLPPFAERAIQDAEDIMLRHARRGADDKQAAEEQERERWDDMGLTPSSWKDVIPGYHHDTPESVDGNETLELVGVSVSDATAVYFVFRTAQSDRLVYIGWRQWNLFAAHLPPQYTIWQHDDDRAVSAWYADQGDLFGSGSSIAGVCMPIRARNADKIPQPPETERAPAYA